MYKSTADVAAGKTMYEVYSDVNDSSEPHFLSLRSIVLARKQPRRMFVQQHTSVQGVCVCVCVCVCEREREKERECGVCVNVCV